MRCSACSCVPDWPRGKTPLDGEVGDELTRLGEDLFPSTGLDEIFALSDADGPSVPEAPVQQRI